MFNSLAVVGAVLLLAGTLFVTTMYSSYYQVMSERLETQATTAASFLQSYATEQEYLSAARYYMTSNPSTPSNPSNPAETGNMELQFLDSDGHILMSSLLDLSLIHI